MGTNGIETLSWRPRRRSWMTWSSSRPSWPPLQLLRQRARGRRKRSLRILNQQRHQKKEKVNESAEEEKAEAKQEFARECIPPVRPQRSRTRPGARLSVPDWQPPKQTIFDYLLSCFKPQAQ